MRTAGAPRSRQGEQNKTSANSVNPPVSDSDAGGSYHARRSQYSQSLIDGVSASAGRVESLPAEEVRPRLPADGLVQNSRLMADMRDVPALLQAQYE